MQINNIKMQMVENDKFGGYECSPVYIRALTGRENEVGVEYFSLKIKTNKKSADC